MASPACTCVQGAMYVHVFLVVVHDLHSSTFVLILIHTVPVTFVDYYKADYPVVSPATVPGDYQFYFVFLRENLFDGNSVDVRRRREGWDLG